MPVGTINYYANSQDFTTVDIDAWLLAREDYGEIVKAFYDLDEWDKDLFYNLLKCVDPEWKGYGQVANQVVSDLLNGDLDKWHFGEYHDAYGDDDLAALGAALADDHYDLYLEAYLDCLQDNDPDYYQWYVDYLKEGQYKYTADTYDSHKYALALAKEGHVTHYGIWMGQQLAIAYRRSTDED